MNIIQLLQELKVVPNGPITPVGMCTGGEFKTVHNVCVHFIKDDYKDVEMSEKVRYAFDCMPDACLVPL